MSRGGADREARILEALSHSKRGPLKPKELARILDVPTSQYRDLKGQLSALERAGKVYRVKGNRFAVPDRLDLVVGTVSLTRNGDGFVRPDAGAGDVFVLGVNLDSAMDGDRVVVRIEDRPRGRSPVGRIIKILERARASVVGTLHEGRRFSYIVPLDRRMTRDVLIAPDGEMSAEEGDVVVVRMVGVSHVLRRRV